MKLVPYPSHIAIVEANPVAIDYEALDPTREVELGRDSKRV